MTLQEDFDALSADYHALKKEWETAKQNLLSGALITPGTLRFGGNTMQLDKDGIQIRTSSAVNVPSLYFSPTLTPTPGASTPYAVLQGYASVVAGNEDVARLDMAILPDSGLEGHSGLISFNTSTGIVQAYWSIITGAVTSELILNSVGGVATLTLTNAVPIFQVSADPASPSDGMIWYNGSTGLYKIRANGVTVTLGGSFDLLTATEWAAKGDLVAGTANDTAAILSIGANGTVLTADSAETTGMKWATPAGGSFSYGKAITTSQGQNLP